MAEAVYILCALTSVVCALMLLRGYMRSRMRLLLWSSLCFSGLAINNILLFVDKVVFPSATGFAGLDFPVWRSLVAVVSLTLLLYGLIWDTE